MATKTMIQLLDDFTGEEAAETVPFALDGVTYTIDLTSENAQRMRADFAKYVSHATRTGGRTTRKSNGSSNGSNGSRSDLAEIREWARINGHEVRDVGRVPKSVIEAYDQRA